MRRSLGPVLGELDGISVGKKQKEKSGREDKEKSQHVAQADRSQLDFYWAPSIADGFELNGSLESPQRESGRYKQKKRVSDRRTEAHSTA